MSTPIFIHHRRLWRITGVVCLSLTLWSCGDKSAAPSARMALLKDCPGFMETGKAPIADGAQCGELMVKENPADPQSAEIGIAILRLPAISPVPQADPLFLIQGGPGGSSIDMANQLHGFFAEVRKNRDLIFIDQRGTGKSNSLACAKLTPAELNLPDAEQLQKQQQLLRDCAQQQGERLRFYTTWHSVQDMDAVRAALGYERINLWGISYGTRVALEYARQFEPHTRSLVLDGVAPTAISLGKYSARDMQAALQQLSQACAAQPLCAAQYGNPLENAEQIYSQLRAAETRGTEINLTYPHPRYQQPVTHRLTPRNFSQLLFVALYSRDMAVLLPQLLSRAAQEDYQLVSALLALAAEQMEQMNVAEAMHFSVVCSEDWPQVSAQDLALTPPFLGFDPLQERAAVCEFWPKAELPEDYWQPIKSSVPSLLLSGQYDPVTPAIWAQTVAQYLPNSVSLTVEGGNHGVSTEGCMPQILAQFIERASMDGIATDCVAQIKTLPFVLGANQAKAPAAEQGVEP